MPLAKCKRRIISKKRGQVKFSIGCIKNTLTPTNVKFNLTPFLTLPLFMLFLFAQHVYNAFAPYDLAIAAYFLY